MIRTLRNNINVSPHVIYLEATAPLMQSSSVEVHYFECGQYKQISVKTMRPTHFDTLVVSSTYGVLPRAKFSFVSATSIRNLCRNLFFLFRQFIALVTGAVIQPTPVLDMRDLEPNNIAHLLVDVIPYYHLARRARGCAITAVFRSVKEPFRSWLKYFDVSFVCEDRSIKAEIVKIFGTRGLSAHELLKTFDCNGIQFVPTTYSEMTCTSGIVCDRIFLARRPPRSLDNQAEVEALMRRYGYLTVFMEDYSYDDQIGIAAHAKNVVALHGAAISLLLLNSRIDSVIEIFPPNVYTQMFPACLGDRVLIYEQIVCGYDHSVAHSGWAAISSFKNRAFAVDLTLLSNLLARIHGQDNRTRAC